MDDPLSNGLEASRTGGLRLHPLSLLLIAHSKKRKARPRTKLDPNTGRASCFGELREGVTVTPWFFEAPDRAEKGRESSPNEGGRSERSCRSKGVPDLSTPPHTPSFSQDYLPTPAIQSIFRIHSHNPLPRAPFHKPENASGRRKGKITDWRLNCVPRHTYNKKT